MSAMMTNYQLEKCRHLYMIDMRKEENRKIVMKIMVITIRLIIMINRCI